MAVVFKTLSATLAANVNEVTFTDSLINSNSVIEVYYNSNDVYTVETWQDGTTIGIVTSDHNFAVGVKVTINNVTSFAPYDDTSLVNQINGLSDDVSGLDGRLDDAEDDIDNLESSVESLGTNKQDVLTAGDNITIENNVISASGSGGVDYSTTERKVGTWIDGSDVYEVVVTNLNLPVTNSWSADFLNELLISDIISCDFYDSSNGIKIEIEQVQLLNYGIRIQHSRAISNRSISRIIIKYLKYSNI